MNLDKLADDLIADEGLELSAYHCTEGKLTIGVGRNLDSNPLSANEERACGHDGRTQPITRNQAMYLLDNDMLRVVANLDIYIPWWQDLDDVRQRVVANLAFQLGIAGLLKFKKMLTHLQNHEYNEAAFELIDSKYSLQTPKRAARNANRLRTGEA
jgi:lysozyme